jgi:hypothetical protein
MSKEKLICGQCKATSLYRDEDYINGVWYVACRICGNRWPGGPAPIRVGEDGIMRDAIETVPAQTINDLKKEGVKMKKPCSNCKRDMSIVRGGRCFVCAKAAEGLSGDELIFALAEIKGKIDRGEIKQGGPGRPCKKARSLQPLPAAGQKPGAIFGGRREMGTLLETAEPQTIIPVTLRLTVEIAVHVNGIVS